MSFGRRGFKIDTIKFIKEHFPGMKIDDESVRYLHRDNIAQVAEPDLEEVLMLIFWVLASNGVRKAKRRHLEEWLGLSRAEPSHAEPVESVAQEEHLWHVRRILRKHARDGKRFNLVDWASTEDPRETPRPQ